jgi:hypothetical protein
MGIHAMSNQNAARVYYEDASVRLYHGDCLDVLPQLGQVDHVITDPPYEAEAHTMGRRAFSGRSDATHPKGIAEERPLGFDPITEAQRASAGALMAGVSCGWVLVFCQVEAAMLWRASLPAKYLRTQIWRKVDGAPQFTGDRPGMGYESIVTCWAGDGRSRWNGGGRHGFYDYPTVKAGTGHQTEKPLALMSELVALFSDEGDTILDPFAGSGTLGAAAKLNGRKAILIEREEKYCEIAAKRLRETEPGRLFDKVPRAKPQSFLSAMGEPERELREDPVLRESHADGNA